MNTSKFSAIAMSAALALASCSDANKQDDQAVIGKPDYKSETGIFGVDAMMALGRVSGAQVSPDGSQILYGISYVSVPENKSNRDLYVMDADGQNQTRITATPKSESGEAWIDGGKKIAFVYPGADGQPQLWVMAADGTSRVQVSDVEGGIGGFLFSPD